MFTANLYDSTELKYAKNKLLKITCRAYSSILGCGFEWKVKVHFLEKRGTFL